MIRIIFRCLEVIITTVYFFSQKKNVVCVRLGLYAFAIYKGVVWIRDYNLRTIIFTAYLVHAPNDS